jgi:hypothetical protein
VPLPPVAEEPPVPVSSPVSELAHAARRADVRRTANSGADRRVVRWVSVFMGGLTRRKWE